MKYFKQLVACVYELAMISKYQTGISVSFILRWR